MSGISSNSCSHLHLELDAWCLNSHSRRWITLHILPTHPGLHSICHVVPPSDLHAMQGGTTSFHRDGVDVAFLNTMAAAIEAAHPHALVLLTATSSAAASHNSTYNISHSDGAGLFMVSGPAGANGPHHQGTAGMRQNTA